MSFGSFLNLLTLADCQVIVRSLAMKLTEVVFLNLVRGLPKQLFFGKTFERDCDAPICCLDRKLARF